ncbi:ATP-binding protein [Streptomyces sp. NPDC020983]|uniref:ATP-binding protein n=1 Tax=Streptomyces sp. NPDC020983 TaxID=3365106 RepID=UPI00379FDC5F
MSLPLTRRIAQAALLLGAAAAPLVGAGAAHAAAPQQAGMGGLTAVDGTELGSTVDHASQSATGLAAHGGGQAVQTALPGAARLVGTAGTTAAPVAHQGAAQATDAAGRVVGATAESLPVAGALPDAGTLPADELPLRALPLG